MARYYLCGDSGRILARVSDLNYEYWDRMAEKWVPHSYVFDHVVMGWAVEINEVVARDLRVHFDRAVWH